MSCILNCSHEDFIIKLDKITEDKEYKNGSFDFSCNNWKCRLFVMNIGCEDTSFLQVYVCEIENVKKKRIYDCESNLVLDWNLKIQSLREF